MHKPLNTYRKPHPLGVFGAKRTHDIHTGIDLYCDENEPVYAMESGVVIEVSDFTGKEAETPWWNDTKCIVIKGGHGYILYGELESFVKEGDRVFEGQCIGEVKRVLKNDKGLPTTMLHLEYYSKYEKGKHASWFKSGNRPKGLLDPNAILKISELDSFFRTKQDLIHFRDLLIKISANLYDYNNPVSLFDNKIIAWIADSRNQNYAILISKADENKYCVSTHFEETTDFTVSTENTKSEEFKCLISSIKKVIKIQNYMPEYTSYIINKTIK